MFKIVRSVTSGEHLTYEQFAIKAFVPGTLTVGEHWELVTNSYNDQPLQFSTEKAAIAFVRSNFGNTEPGKNWEDVVELALK